MSRKIKLQPAGKVLPVLNCAEKAGPEPEVVFGFEWMTENRRHNLKFLDSQKSGRELEVLQDLFERLAYWSSCSWEELKSLRKQEGFETLLKGEMKEDITDKVPRELSAPDMKLLVFRFSKDGRMVAIPSAKTQGALEILGFDWDYSLYNHGS